MDLIVAGYVWSDHVHFWLYPLLAALGASVGSLVPFYVGRAGGEWVLLKRMDHAKYERLHARFQRYNWLAVMIPAAMPPPFPFKLFAFGAGVFDIRVLPYMAAVFTGRAIHYFVLAVLVLRFGPQIVDLAMQTMKHHALGIVVLCVFLIFGFGAVLFHKRRRKRKLAALD